MRIDYRVHCYGNDPLSGAEVAAALGEDPSAVFKTLVTMGKPKSYHVFLVPVTGELDLKKAAASVGEKSVTMVRQDELLSLTGYVHGGCSPLCIRRPMSITIDSTAERKERIYFSAGRIGYQLEVEVADLPKMMDFRFVDLRRRIVGFGRRASMHLKKRKRRMFRQSPIHATLRKSLPIAQIRVRDCRN